MTDTQKILELEAEVLILRGQIERREDVIVGQAKQIDSLVDQVKNARNILNAICEINEDV